MIQLPLTTKSHLVLPVIHTENLDQALRNTRIAHDAGADGIFLVNHSIPSRKLLDLTGNVRAEFPDFWIGVNLLDLEPEEALAVLDDQISGVWTDNAEIDERQLEQPQAGQLKELRKKRSWPGTHFGGVDFKY